jgi:hypothetical protein
LSHQREDYRTSYDRVAAEYVRRIADELQHKPFDRQLLDRFAVSVRDGNAMALNKRGNYRYGDSQIDIREELRCYSQLNGYIADHFADAACQCGGTLFRLGLDDAQGVAIRTCCTCDAEHPVADSEEYLEGADLQECACPCGGEELEITVGMSLHQDSEDVRWLYLACRRPQCGLTAVYGDWTNEFIGNRELLARI